MKTLRQLSVALVLMLALTMPTFAGEIQTTYTSPPPPPPPGEIQTTAPGQIDTGAPGTIDTPPAPSASATQAALNLLQDLLGLL